MSSIASLYNVPTTLAEQSTWSFLHRSHHEDINRAVFEQLGIQLPEYILDPFFPEDPDGFQVWLDQHQNLHQVMDAALGIAGFDLSDVEWKDVNVRTGWIFLNAQEHIQAADILGIG